MSKLIDLFNTIANTVNDMNDTVAYNRDKEFLVNKLYECKVCKKTFEGRDPKHGYSNNWCSDKCAQSTVKETSKLVKSFVKHKCPRCKAFRAKKKDKLCGFCLGTPRGESYDEWKDNENTAPVDTPDPDPDFTSYDDEL